MNSKKNGTLTIGQLAQAGGVRATTLRFYERERILMPAQRSAAGYRLYDEQAVERLRFIRSAQAIGFTLDDIRTLLALDDAGACDEVRDLIARRLSEVDARLGDLQRVRGSLVDALQRCDRSNQECDVLIDLKDESREAPLT